MSYLWDFKGCDGRLKYVALLIASGILHGVVMLAPIGVGLEKISSLISISIILFSWAVSQFASCVRRLHHIGLPGYWLIALILFSGVAYYVGSNRFGEAIGNLFAIIPYLFLLLWPGRTDNNPYSEGNNYYKPSKQKNRYGDATYKINLKYPIEEDEIELIASLKSISPQIIRVTLPKTRDYISVIIGGEKPQLVFKEVKKEINPMESKKNLKGRLCSVSTRL